MNKKSTIISIVVAVLLFMGIGWFVYQSVPHKPHVDVAAVADLDKYSSADEWTGKVFKWRVKEEGFQFNATEQKAYGYFGKVVLDGDSGFIYGGFGLKTNPKHKVEVHPGDYIYAKMTKTTNNK